MSGGPLPPSFPTPPSPRLCALRSLAPQLSGSLLASGDGIQLHLRGRPDEACDLVLNLAPLPPPPPEAGGEAVEEGAATADAEAVVESARPPERCTFALRRGQLRVEVRSGERWSAVEVASLSLDELELASLRGMLQAAELQLDFGKRRGRGAISVVGPRFSGLQGTSLDAAALWEGGVVRLSKGVLVQARSRYEVEAAYHLPNPEVEPSVIAAAVGGEGTGEGAIGGRWQLKVVVPGAEVEEMLPAARLLSRRAAAASDYTRAKAAFVDGVRDASVAAETLSRQVHSALQVRCVAQGRGSCGTPLYSLPSEPPPLSPRRGRSPPARLPSSVLQACVRPARRRTPSLRAPLPPHVPPPLK